jgi:hypothetical protein
MSLENFHSYECGRKFTIYTDHLSNTLLWTTKNHQKREKNI